MTGSRGKGAAGAIVARGFAPQFPIDLVEKDFGYVDATARVIAADVPVSRAGGGVFRRAKEGGFADSDITGVAQLY